MTEQIVLIVLFVPLVWCAAVSGVRRLGGSKIPEDRVEKYQLLIMLAPIVLGMVWIALAPFLSLSLPLPLPSLDDVGSTAPTAHLAAAAQPAKVVIDLKSWIFTGILAIWASGGIVLTLRLMLSLMRLGHIVGRGGQGEIGDVLVRFSRSSLPPLAWGRATILLPAHLATQMAPEELRLVIRHEQAHLERKDPFYFAALSLLDALAWFNPFLRAQTQRCRTAAELACDAAACGKTSMEREAYARVLIRTLKHTAGDMLQHAPAAISNVKSGDYRMRLSEIMHAAPAVRKPKRLWLYGTLALALMPVTALQFAWAQGATPLQAAQVHAGTPSVQATASAFIAPVDGPISEGFGRRAKPVNGQMFHQGTDFRVPIGTPVRAPADGKVSVVTVKWGYGKIIEIDHGNGLKTRFAHLDSQKVAVGDNVKAGQIIALTGNTGIGTGPHLHFEVWKHGKPVNPATVLPKAG